MGIILYIIFGAIVGWIASKIMGRSEGILADIVVGIVGAFLGSLIMNAFGKTGVTTFSIRSFVVALVGSVVLLFVLNMVRRGTHHPAA